MTDNRAETVNTVLGSINVSELGETLTHEHICANYTEFYKIPEYVQSICKQPFQSFRLKEVDLLQRTKPFLAINFVLNDKELLQLFIHELNSFRAYGGKTIVDNSNVAAYRNINMMKEISKATNVNVIVGTGFHVNGMQFECNMNNAKTEIIYDHMYQEMEDGCYDCSDVKAGFVRQIYSTWPIQEYERYSINATGLLQEDLRCSVSFYSENDIHALLEILRLYQEAGGDARKVVMSHTDYSSMAKNDLLEFLDDSKCYVQLSKFGIQYSLYNWYTSDDVLSDARRIKCLALLKKENELHRVLISHDIHSKDRLMTFGGHGYVHIAKNIVPHLLAKDFLKEDIQLLKVENPKRWLTKL